MTTNVRDSGRNESSQGDPSAVGAIDGEKSDSGGERLPKRLDLSILRYLRRIIRSVDLYSSKLRTTYQITAPQLICLLALIESGPMTAARLAARVHLSASTMVGIVDRLEKKGLIRRDRDSQDRRQIIVVATRDGETLAQRAPSPLQDGLARALTNLSDLEQTAIALSLEKIVDLMETEDFEAAPILETGHLVDDSAES